MTSNTYQETIQYLYSLLPMYQRDGQSAFKKDLHRTLQLCNVLGHPETKFPSIHIAGTNGKGSVSSMLHSILVSEGYKTGIYTSPHLLDFSERIRINRQNISPEEVMDFVNKHQALIEDVSPSFFEFTVAMAFDHFAKHEVDIAVVEVGLGGRLDSTNILTPLLSIITNVSYDHMDMLGDTLPEIAAEKAGIIKPGVPVIIGETHPETKAVFIETAERIGAKISFADQHYSATQLENHWEYANFQLTDLFTNTSRTLNLDLPGSYQTYNLATLWEALDHIRGMDIGVKDSSIEEGLRNVKYLSGLRGRMELIRDRPLILADTAHNLSGVEQLASQINTLSVRNKIIVWGMVKEKNHQQILSLLPNDAYFIFVRPDIPRGLEADVLLDLATHQGKSGESIRSVQEGVKKALSIAKDDDLILIGGSTFVIAEVLPSFEKLIDKKIA